jgi:mediator of RNA polymerase II transcription subunit 27
METDYPHVIVHFVSIKFICYINYRDVEQAVNSLSPPPGPFNLGNTAYLSQESIQDRQALYSQLVNSYKWTDKVCKFCIS